MYTLAVVILTLLTASTLLYGVWRLAIYRAEREMDQFRGCGLTASLKDRITRTTIMAEGAAATAANPGLENPDDAPASARPGAGGAAVSGDGRRYVSKGPKLLAVTRQRL